MLAFRWFPELDSPSSQGASLTKCNECELLQLMNSPSSLALSAQIRSCTCSENRAPFIKIKWGLKFKMFSSLSSETKQNTHSCIHMCTFYIFNLERIKPMWVWAVNLSLKHSVAHRLFLISSMQFQPLSNEREWDYWQSKNIL